MPPRQSRECSHGYTITVYTRSYHAPHPSMGCVAIVESGGINVNRIFADLYYLNDWYMLSAMKLPRDPNQRAKAIMEQAFQPKPEKNPAAVAMGKLGGTARAKSLSPERRAEIAKNAIKARWNKKK